MNSNDNINTHKNPHETSSAQGTTFVFETTMGGIKGPRMHINKLQTINTDTIDEWLQQLKTLFTLSNQTPEERKAVIKLLLDQTLHYIVDDKHDTDSIIDAIYKEAFNAKNTYIFENKLKNLKLNDCSTVPEFQR
ncbi:hypothetical protein H311_05130, partial [Anncaliia algerae PRA109]